MNRNCREEYLKRINKVLDYIANHLEEELSLNKLARLSCFSDFHFHRIFRALIGESVGVYQRRVRLEKAAYMLRFNPSMSITDIAFSLGFNSSSSFNRAFKKYFNHTPGELRKSLSFNIFKEKILLKNTEKPDVIKHWEVKYLDSICVYFYRYTGSYKNNAVFDAWCRHITSAFEKGIIDEETRYYGIVHDDPDITDDDKCRYDCCISTDKELDKDIKEIPSGEYAVFDFEGYAGDDVINSYKWIYGVWLPENNYEPENIPGYNDYYDFKPGSAVSDGGFVRYRICIPVKKYS